MESNINEKISCSMITNRETPQIVKVDFSEYEEGDYDIYDLYNEDDRVVFFEMDDIIFSLDFDEKLIGFHNSDTYIMNLLYARKHSKEIYNLFYKEWKNYGKAN